MGKGGKKANGDKGGKGKAGKGGKGSKGAKNNKGGESDGKEAVKRRRPAWQNETTQSKAPTGKKEPQAAVETDGMAWYEVPLPTKKLSLRDQIRGTGNEKAMEQLQYEARSAYDERCRAVQAKASSDQKWLAQMAAKGTASDRVAALATQLTSNPRDLPSNLPLLTDLISIATKKANVSRTALEAAVELMTEKVMPPDRRLVSLAARRPTELPEDPQQRKKVLHYWYFEDQLKVLYGKLVQTLKEGSGSTVEAIKSHSVKQIYNLLSKVPEEEKTLLGILVNRLGDLIPKMASRASHYLLLLLKDHPNMRSVVVKELENFVFRKNNPIKAQFYTTSVLSQIMLSKGDYELPQKLLELYFTLFTKVAKEGNIDHRIMNNLLTGIRRAFPFSHHTSTNMQRFYTPLFSIAALSAFPHRVAALTILFQVIENGERSIVDRYYNSLYHLLMATPSSVDNMTSSKLALFFSLLYKSFQFDKDQTRLLACIHRLLQVCLQQRPPYICGALFLIGEILKSNKSLRTYITRQGQLLASTPKPAASKDACNTDQASEGGEDDDEASEEGFRTVVKAKAGKAKPVKPAPAAPPSAPAEEELRYDPNARNPLSAKAEREFLWILGTMCNHYHPSVATFAIHIREGVNIAYEGDPLADFTLPAFLDNFAFRKPKKQHVEKIREGLDAALRRKVSRRSTLLHNSNAFIDLPASKIDIQDAFFYKYFTGRKAKLLELEKAKSHGGAEDEEDGLEREGAADEEDEEMVDEEEMEEEEEGEEGMEEEEEMEGVEEEEEEEEEAEEPVGAPQKKRTKLEGDAPSEFERLFCKYSYDDMDKDPNVIADYHQDQMGVTDEGVDETDLLEDVEEGPDPIDDIEISDAEGGVDEVGDDGDEDEDEPDFEGAVKAGELDAFAELDAQVMGRKDSKSLAAMAAATGVKQTKKQSAEPVEADDHDDDDDDEMEAQQEMEALASDSDGMADDASEEDDEDEEDREDAVAMGKKQKRGGKATMEKAFDVTRGSLKKLGKADPDDFNSIMERGARRGSKFDDWVDKTNRVGARSHQLRKGGKGGKGRKGGKGSKGGKGGKRRR